MRIDTTNRNEWSPARGMRQERVLTPNKADLGLAQRQHRISLAEKRTVEGDKETATQSVIDVPEAGHDGRDSRRQERAAEAQRALDARHRPGCGTTRCDDDDPCDGKRAP